MINTHIIVRMLLNQFVMSIFGIMLALSTANIGKEVCGLASCIAIFLYFFLIYTNLWDKGAKDVIADTRTGKNSRAKGFLYSFLASIPTIILTLVFSVITPQMTQVSNFANILYAISKMCLTFVFQGMYHGMAYIFDYHFLFYIVALFPAIIVGGIAYLMGYNNFRIFPVKSGK